MRIVSAKSRLLLKLRKSSFSEANHRSPQCLHCSGRIVPVPPAPALVSPRHWRQWFRRYAGLPKGSPTHSETVARLSVAYGVALGLATAKNAQK